MRGGVPHLTFWFKPNKRHTHLHSMSRINALTASRWLTPPRHRPEYKQFEGQLKRKASMLDVNEHRAKYIEIDQTTEALDFETDQTAETQDYQHVNLFEFTPCPNGKFGNPMFTKTSPDGKFDDPIFTNSSPDGKSDDPMFTNSRPDGPTTSLITPSSPNRAPTASLMTPSPSTPALSSRKISPAS